MFKAEYFFPRILLPFLIGILLSYFYTTRNFLNSTIVLFAVLFISLVLLNIYYKNLNLYKYKGYIGAVIFVFFFNLGSLICLSHKDKLSVNYFANKRYTALKINVVNEPQQNGKITRFIGEIKNGYLKDRKEVASGKLLVLLTTSESKAKAINYGDELIIPTTYTEVEAPKNPSEFDFHFWLATQNIYHQIFIKENKFINTGLNRGNPIIRFAYGLRKKAVQKYRKLLKNDAAFSIASTLVLGYKADLDSDTRTNFANTGTMHALSVSGAHVGIIYIVLELLLRFFNRDKRFIWLKPVLICLLIWSYAILTGLSPSVVRASIMLSIFVLAKSFTKSKNGYNILAFAAFVQLLYDPFLILNVGFQLSYLAVFGLLYLQRKIYNLIAIKNKVVKSIWNFTALSLSAQLVTFPFAIYYFHKFPVYFIIGNLFITLPLSVMMYLGIIVLMPGFSFLAPFFEWIINFTNNSLRIIASLPLSTIDAIWITFFEFLLLSLALSFGVFGIVNLKKKLIFLSIISFLTYQISTSLNFYLKIKQQKIIFFSLRKNYAAAFIKGNNAILLTDLQANDKSFLYSVKPELDHLAITNITFYKIADEVTNKNISIKNHQLIFEKYKLLIIDSTLNYKKIKSSSSFNALWVNGNPKFKLDSSINKISFKTLILDATNNFYKAEEFKRIAQANKKNAIDLKKNGALVIDLNERNK